MLPSFFFFDGEAVTGVILGSADERGLSCGAYT